jgi:hypothetical protein
VRRLGWRRTGHHGRIPGPAAHHWVEVRSARRIDYFDDPSAPKASSIVLSANALVVNDAGELLLIHRTDNDNWSLPGGAMEPASR